MGYLEEVQAGHIFVPLTPKETCPAPDCGRLAQAHVRFVLPSGNKGAHIKAFCSECGFRRELSLKNYGPLLREFFPEIADYLASSSSKKRTKSFDSGGPEFYAAFDWCCVYCEGFRLARDYRLKQIQELEGDALRNPRFKGEQDDFDLGLEMSTSELMAGGRALENIFDLVPDHLIPAWVQQLDGLYWENGAKQKAERAWVVSAHRSCNSKRKRRLESADFLLFVYSRYLFPALKLSDKDKVRDMLSFAEVLHRIELYKEARQITELKPARRAI